MEVVNIEMWFEPPSGLTFKLTTTVKADTWEDAYKEALALAQMNWDYNKSHGFRPITARPG